MLQHIVNNPLRILGVYANSTKKDIVANQGKMKAFLKVGKSVSFPLDLDALLPKVDRTAESVARADAAISLPNDRLAAGEFWFACTDDNDREAFKLLASGNIDGAINVWDTQDDGLCARHNLIVCYLIKGNYQKAIKLAERLYRKHDKGLASLILGEDSGMTADAASLFLDALVEDLGVELVLKYVSDPDWRRRLSSDAVSPIVDEIQKAIALSERSKGAGADARYAAGIELMESTKQPLAQLKALLGDDNPQYQLMADKLGCTILDCGIGYFNESTDDDADQKAMTLQAYATSIVMGDAAKKRCHDNIKILQEIIDNRPPQDVRQQDKAIRNALSAYAQTDDSFENALELINNTKPYLQDIEAKRGKDDPYYIRISTLVGKNAMANVISLINASQRNMISKEDYFAMYYPGNKLAQYDTFSYNEWVRFHNNQIYQFRDELRQAWGVLQQIDDLAMDPNDKHYSDNRATLISMCRNSNISTITLKEIRETRKIIGTTVKVLGGLALVGLAWAAIAGGIADLGLASVWIGIISIIGAGINWLIQRDFGPGGGRTTAGLVVVGLALIVVSVACQAVVDRQKHVDKINAEIQGVEEYLSEIDGSVTFADPADDSVAPLKRLGGLMFSLRMALADAKLYNVQTDILERADAFMKENAGALYAQALSQNTEEAWRLYKRIVPSELYYDASSKIDSISQAHWGTEEAAWTTASLDDNIESYKKYLKAYPSGNHYNQVNDKLLACERAELGLPRNHGTTVIEVFNRTSNSIVIKYSGNSKRDISIKPHSSAAVRVLNGKYSISATSSDNTVRSSFAEENFNGGYQSFEFTVSTSIF